MGLDLKGLFESAEARKVGEPCKGLIFRCRQSMFFDPMSNKVEERVSMKLLKRKSCPGCEVCRWMFDDMRDLISTNSVILPSKVKDGGTYKLAVVNMSTDYDTGYLDNWDFEFQEIKQEVESNGIRDSDKRAIRGAAARGVSGVTVERGKGAGLPVRE